MTHPNAQLIERLYGMYATGDTATIGEYLADDVVVHVPGKNPTAGDYKGRNGFFEFMSKTMELAGDAPTVELEAVVADDERAVTFERFVATRAGKHIDVRDNTVFRFRGGQIVEMIMLSTNPYAHDEFWS